MTPKEVAPAETTTTELATTDVATVEMAAPAAPKVGPRAPAGTTVRFAALLAVVIATAVYIFVTAHLHLPGRADDLASTIERCNAALETVPGWDGVGTPDRAAGRAAIRDWRACVAAPFGDLGVAIGIGTAALAVATGVGYFAYPVVIQRRQRLRRLTATNAPTLVAYLDQLSVDAGLARPPRWALAPSRRTAGGQAFGLPGHRVVQIDAGLLPAYATDRPVFRAVVLHELAHVRNRDIDLTYLTMSLWRAFLAVALLPYVILQLHPNAFVTPLIWRWDSGILARPAETASAVAAIGVLTAMVYWGRNAVLRIRELHADAEAAAVDGPRTALPAALERLPTRQHPNRPWRRWGTHPDVARRLEATRDPSTLLAPDLWAPFAVGLAAGVIAPTITAPAAFPLGPDPILGPAAVGAFIGSLLATVIAIEVWRGGLRRPGRWPSARAWLLAPLALVGAFLAGGSVSIFAIDNPGLGLAPGSLPNISLGAVGLAVGAVVLAVWVGGATVGVLVAPAPRRWALPAIVAVAALIGISAMAVWWVESRSLSGFVPRWGVPPEFGAGIDWYAEMVAWVVADLGPVDRFVHNPLTLPTLTLMWLVPVLAGLPRPSAVPGPDHVPVRRAAAATAVGLVVIASAVAALPSAFIATLPDDVRRDPDPAATGTAFFLFLDNLTSLTIALGIAVVMTVLVLRDDRHGLTLAVLSATALGGATIALYWFVAYPVQCLTNVWELKPALARCLPVMRTELIGGYVGLTVVQGLLLAVPLMAAAWAVRALIRRKWRHRVPVAPSARPYGWLAFTTTIVALTLVAAVAGWLTWADLPGVRNLWLPYLLD